MGEYSIHREGVPYMGEYSIHREGNSLYMGEYSIHREGKSLYMGEYSIHREGKSLYMGEYSIHREGTSLYMGEYSIHREGKSLYMGEYSIHREGTSLYMGEYSIHREGTSLYMGEYSIHREGTSLYMGEYSIHREGTSLYMGEYSIHREGTSLYMGEYSIHREGKSLYMGEYSIHREGKSLYMGEYSIHREGNSLYMGEYSIHREGTSLYMGEYSIHREGKSLYMGEYSIHREGKSLYMGEYSIHREGNSLYMGEYSIHREGVPYMGEYSIHREGNSLYMGEYSIHREGTSLYMGEYSIHREGKSLYMGEYSIHREGTSLYMGEYSIHREGKSLYMGEYSIHREGTSLYMGEYSIHREGTSLYMGEYSIHREGTSLYMGEYSIHREGTSLYMGEYSIHREGTSLYMGEYSIHREGKSLYMGEYSIHREGKSLYMGEYSIHREGNSLYMGEYSIHREGTSLYMGEYSIHREGKSLYMGEYSIHREGKSLYMGEYSIHREGNSLYMGEYSIHREGKSLYMGEYSIHREGVPVDVAYSPAGPLRQSKGLAPGDESGCPMDQYVSYPYYHGYKIPMTDQRPYRPPVNQSVRSERAPDRDGRPVGNKSDLRRTSSFHGGAADKGPGISDVSRLANDEFNRLCSGKIPVYGQAAGKRDMAFMMDSVKEQTKPKEESKWPARISSRQMLRTLGAGGVQVCVGFFFAATQVTLLAHLVTSPILTDNVNPNLHRIVFLVFSALASACGAMLVLAVPYRKLITSGAMLLIFSCLSASLVTSGRFMFLPYGVIAGSAHGLLRTVSMVAAADVSSHYRVTSVSCATLGHAVGGIVGTFVYYFFMTDYLTSDTWPNNFRVLELVAVLALLAGCALHQRPVRPAARVGGRVLADPGFHSVACLQGLVFLAIGILYYIIPVLPAARGFQFHKFQTFFNPLFSLYCGQWVGAFTLALTGSVCGKALGRAGLFVGGVAVFLLGVALMPHYVAYESFWAYMGLAFGVGVAVAFAQSLVTVGVARRVGGASVGVSVSLLMFWQDVGTTMGVVCVDQLDSHFTLDVALYVAGGALLLAGLAFIICCYTVVPLHRSRHTQTPDSQDYREDRQTGIHNPAWDDGYDYNYRYMH
ncbi:hypothetical protein ACOMHN_052404 [Nucella lapillus]